MIQKIRLRNWKSHQESDFQFTKGTNMLVGPMGSGKSSVLQAISFALFGTFSELKSKDIKIAELTNRNNKASFSEIELELDNLIIKRKIDGDKSGEAAVREKSGRLLAGTNPNQVTDYLKESLKIDEDVFLRTVYAKQNEVDAFLKLARGERRQKLDELMGLDKFDSARKNCIKLTNTLETKKKSREGFLQSFSLAQMDSELTDISLEIKKSKSEKETIIKFTEAAQSEKSGLELEVKRLRAQFEEYARLEERRGIAASQMKDLEEKLSATKLDKSLEFIVVRLVELRARLEELARDKKNLEENFRSANEASLTLEKKFGGLEHQSEETARQLDVLNKARQELSQLEQHGNLVAVERLISDSRQTAQNKIMARQEMSGEINILQKHLGDLEGASGSCPVCSARLEEATKASLVSERQAKIAQLKNKISEYDAGVREAEKKISEFEDIREGQKRLIAKLEDEEQLRQQDKELAMQLSEIKGKREVLQQSSHEFSLRVQQIEFEKQKLDSEQAQLLEQRHLYELKAQLASITEEYNKVQLEMNRKRVEPDRLRDIDIKFQEAIAKLQGLLSKEEHLSELIVEKEKRFAELENRKSQASGLVQEIKLLEGKIEFLVQFKNALLVAQEMLRRELIIAVNEVMSSVWGQLYPYDKWSSVRLNVDENDYILQLKDIDGNFVNVAGFASGGERMLACLSLRIAFAKVMAPNLNILILDEPTHNLDEKAISTFVDVLRDNQLAFLDQLFIVTHDEKLAEAGENVIRLK